MTSGYFSDSIDDTFAYTSWAWQFIEALKEGIIYPRWTPLSFLGFGSPTFILYSPFAFYLVAFLNTCTDSLIVAMNIAKFISFFISALGLFFFVKEFYSVKVALLTASFYLILPFHIFGVYKSGAFISTVSLVWFSPILLFVHRFIDRKEYKYIIYAGICYGFLILTHLVNTYMFTFVLIAFVIYLSMVKRAPKNIIIIPLIITIGIFISAAYIFPLVSEKQFINFRAFIGESGSFHYANYFILPNLTDKLPSYLFWPVYYNTFVSYVLFFSFFLLFILFQILKMNKLEEMENANRINKFFFGTALFSLFLLFGISSFIWDNIPYLKYMQFPVRWLNITAFCAVFLSATIFFLINPFHKEKKRYNFLIYILFFICILLDYQIISSAHIFKEKDILPVKTVNWTMEHLPVNVNVENIVKNADYKVKIVDSEGEGDFKIRAWKSAERIIESRANQTLTLRIRTFNFPGWTAYIDNMQTEIRTKKDIGDMLIDIPSGEHILRLRFVDTPIRYYSKLISLFSFFLMAFLVMTKKK